MIVAGGFESDTDRKLEAVEVVGKAAEFDRSVRKNQALARPPAGRFDEDFMAQLGDVDGYQNCGRLRRLSKGHCGRLLSGSRHTFSLGDLLPAMAQGVGSRSLRFLDPTPCLLHRSSFHDFVWCYGPEFVAKDLRKW